MSVSNGEDADENTFNTSFMSREVDTSTIGTIDLNNSGSAFITDLQLTLNNEFAEIDSLRTLSGTSEGDDDLGTFTGVTIPDSSTIKAALQALETEVENKVTLVSSTDNAVVRFDSNTGQVQDSGVLIDDSDNVTGINDLTIDGNLTVNGTTTTVNTATMDVEDANITLNDGGDQSIADTNVAGFTVEMSDATDARLGYDSTLTSRFKCGDSGSELEIVTVSAAQVITNKDIDGGTASNSNRLTVPKNTTANLTSLTRKEATIFFDTDQGQFFGDDGSSIIPLGGGSGGGGVKSFLTGDSSTFENGIGDWVEFDDGSVSEPVDGTGSTAANLTVAVTTVSGEVLVDDQSLEIAKGAADAQGEGISVDFTVDPFEEDGQREIDISFKYKTGAGYVDGHYRVFVYDVTNAQVLNVTTLDSDGSLPPAPSGLQFTGSFFAQDGSTSYRLIIMGTSTDATAFDMFLDDVKASPKSFFHAPIRTGPVPFTPVFEGFGSPTSVVAFWQRDGSDLLMDVRFNSGAPTGVQARVHFPTEASAGASSVIAGLHQAGVYMRGSTTTEHGGPIWAEPGNSYFTFGSEGTFSNTSTDPTTQQTGSGAFVNGQFISFQARIPIANWDSSALLSSTQVNNQTLKFRYTTDAGQVIGQSSATTLVFEDVLQEDFDGAMNTSTGVWTAPRPGIIHVECGFRYGSAAWNTGPEANLRIHKNGSTEKFIDTFEVDPAATVVLALNGSAIVQVNEGDEIELVTFHNSNANKTIENVQERNYLDIYYLHDFSRIGVFSPFDIVSAQSSTKTPSGSGHWHQHTGNSLVLNPGIWELTSSICNFGNSGTPVYRRMICQWKAENGDDTGTTPDDVTTLSGLTVLHGIASVPKDVQIATGTFDNNRLEVSPMTIQLTEQQTIYLDTFSTMDTPGNARIFVFPVARRLV